MPKPPRQPAQPPKPARPSRSAQAAKPAAPARRTPASEGALAALPHVEPASRAHWRTWLAQNHTQTTGIWLVYAKKSAGGSLTYAEAVEEALCFGWIDSVVKPVDERRWRQHFTPRKPRSTWSKVNKERLARLEAAGLIHPAGQSKIDAAKADGSWTALDAVEALIVPPDFQRALRSDPSASKNFHALTPGVRKRYLYWIASAKRPQTRAARIAKAVTLARAGSKEPR